MAELNAELVAKMREFSPVPGDTGSDDGDSISQETTDAQVELDPDHAEERFRVDRRKLEQMLQGSEAEQKAAEGFFQKIMLETNTQITWPSKLKIGAKSKKDPHVKVCGKKDAVTMAKDKIMAVLDTKTNRVTLKMDVSHTDHSHVIGKGGNNIKRVMQDTGCHIHFPDSNRNTQSEKSNQVSIAGQPGGVEQARTKIRDLLPLVFTFELPVSGMLQPVPDASSPTLQQIQQNYDVTVTIKQRPRMYTSQVVVRGTVNNNKAVKEATAIIIEHLVGSLGASLPVSTQLEIAQQHHLFMIGRSGANIKQIMQQTGASIHFPDPNTANPQRKGTVYITGGIESVYLARQQLIGCLPLVLMFDMKDDIEVEQGRLATLMEQLDVFISVKPKPKQPSKSVIVKSIERNASNMYDARLQLLGLSHSSTTSVIRQQLGQGHTFTSQPVSSNLSLASLGLITPGLLSVNTNNILMLNGTLGSPITSPSVTNPGGVVSPGLMLLTPPYTPTQVHVPSSASSQVQLAAKRDLNHNTAIVRVPTPSDKASSSSNSPCDSPTTSSAVDIDMVNIINISSRQHELIRTPSDDAMPYHHHQDSHPQQNIQSRHKEPLLFRPLENASLRLETGLSRHPDSGGIRPDCSRFESAGMRHDCSRSRHESMPPSRQDSRCIISSSLRHNGYTESIPSPMNPVPSPNNSGSRAILSCMRDPNHTKKVASPSSSGSRTMLSCMRDPNATIDLASSLGSLTGSPPTMKKFDDNSPFQNGQLTPDPDPDSNDRRAPGSHRPLPGTMLGQESLLIGKGLFNWDIDYEEKKLLATKAIQKKPLGESRTPTDFWSGLGFSKSMPDSAIRELLEQRKNRYTGPTMSPMYEDGPTEEAESTPTSKASPIDRDPWKNSEPPGQPMSQPLNPTSFTSPGKNVIETCMNNSNPMMTRSSIWPKPNPPPGFDTERAHPDMAELFSKLGLGKYTDLFQQQEIDLQTFLTLTDQDLKDIGISTFGARKKMLLAIADLNKCETLFSAPSSTQSNMFRDSGLLCNRRHDIASQSGRW